MYIVIYFCNMKVILIALDFNCLEFETVSVGHSKKLYRYIFVVVKNYKFYIFFTLIVTQSQLTLKFCTFQENHPFLRQLRYLKQMLSLHLMSYWQLVAVV